MGSSLGNYSDAEVEDFLNLLSKHMAFNDRFLLAVDTPHSESKAKEKIIAAYND